VPYRGGTRSDTLAPVRRLIVLGGISLVAAGCGGAQVAAPLPETVQGSTPQTTTSQKPVAGNAVAGKSAFASAGCGGCHAFKAAGTSATIGPNLDKVTADAKAAGQPLGTFTQDSIVNPNGYIAKGYQPNVMPQTFGQSLSATQIADLVAFINQNQ
jgi:cytochrome c551/c552